GRACRAGGSAQRNAEPEGAAVGELTVDPHAAAHELHQTLADAQAQASAPVLTRDRAVNLGEGLEETLAVLRVDADARVHDFETHHDSVGRLLAKLDHHAHAARLRELQRVSDQVQ